MIVSWLAVVGSGCDGAFARTRPPFDQATFRATVVSRVWRNQTGAFLLRADGVVEFREGPSDGSIWGDACRHGSESAHEWRWQLEVVPRGALTLHFRLPETAAHCTLNSTWFSDSGPLDWLILSTADGERLHFSCPK